MEVKESTTDPVPAGASRSSRSATKSPADAMATSDSEDVPPPKPDEEKGARGKKNGDGSAASAGGGAGGKKKAAADKKPARTAKKGKLATVVKSFPIEVVTRVLSYCDPSTLLKLSVTCNMFRNITHGTHSRAGPIWEGAFRSIGIALPFKAQDAHLIRYAALLFDKHCSICARRAPLAQWSARLRLCKPCQKRCCNTSYSLRFATRSAVDAMSRAPVAAAGEVSEEGADDGDDDEAGGDEDEEEDEAEGGEPMNEDAPQTYAAAAGASGGGTATAVVGCVGDVHPSASSCVLSFQCGKKPVSYLPDLLAHNDELLRLEDLDIKEFGSKAKADRFPGWLGSSLTTSDLKGTRVQKYVAARTVELVKVRQDITTLQMFEYRAARKTRTENTSMAHGRVAAITEKMVGLGYDPVDIASAAQNEGKQNFNKKQNLTDRVWKLQKENLVGSVEAAKARRLAAERAAAQKAHEIQVLKPVLLSVITQSSFTSDSPVVKTAGGSVAAWTKAFSHDELRDHFANFSIDISNAIKDPNDPLWLDQDAFGEALADDIREWWSLVEPLVLQIAETNTRDLSALSAPALLAKLIVGCRECRKVFKFTSITSHVAEGHQLFIDSKHADVIFGSVEAITSAFSGIASLKNGFVAASETVDGLYQRGAVFGCQPCKWVYVPKAQKGKASTSASASTAQQTSSKEVEPAGKGRKKGKGKGKAAAEDLPAPTLGDPKAKSLDVVWTRGIAPAAAPLTADSSSLYGLVQTNLDVDSLLKHVCGPTLSSFSEPGKEWAGCSRFSSTSKVIKSLTTNEDRIRKQHNRSYLFGMYGMFGDEYPYDEGYDSYDEY